MKAFLWVVLLSVSIFRIEASEIKWHSVLDLVKEKDNTKPIYLYASSGEDYFSKKFQTETLANNEIVDLLNEKFYAVKFDGGDTNIFTVKKSTTSDKDMFLEGKKVNMYSFWQKNKLRAVPAHLFLEPNYRTIHTDYGYKLIDDFEAKLHYCLEEEREVGFDDYVSKFKFEKAITQVLKDLPNNFKNIKGAEDKELTIMLTTAYHTDVLVPNSQKCNVFDRVDKEYKDFYQFRALLASKVDIDSAYTAMDSWKELMDDCDFRTVTKSSMVVKKELIKDRTDLFGQVYYVLVGPTDEYKNATIKLGISPEVLDKGKVSLYLYIENAPE